MSITDAAKIDIIFETSKSFLPFLYFSGVLFGELENTC
jgi:hypothetical protein